MPQISPISWLVLPFFFFFFFFVFLFSFWWSFFPFYCFHGGVVNGYFCCDNVFFNFWAW